MNNTKIMISEVDVFIALLNNFDLDYKKLRKVIQKLMRRTNSHISEGFLKFLLSTKTPHKYIQQALDERYAIVDAIQQAKDLGACGMVKLDDEVYPIKIFLGKGCDGWIFNNEYVAATQIAYHVMSIVKSRAKKCTVFLFTAYGFSGIPQEVAIDKQQRLPLHTKKHFDIGDCEIDCKFKDYEEGV